ncbi:hypothetical protein QNI22_07795 [Cytophagaceae bacterium BD1B2-1]|uniref:Uncharacterized protein n=2 Tax=Xanthocytophaga agilis TaxID=3048010 RepID=A0AAE3R4I8_9BACT|nr:hypothetical protein [Xanthocytophaga agilis]
MNLNMFTTLRKYSLVFASLLVSVLPTVAQDIVYQNNGKKVDCKIIEINPQKIKYKIPQNPGPAYSMDAGDVLMAFSSTGNYVVYPLNGDNAQAAGFMNTPANKQNDLIITLDNQVIAVIELSLNDKEVKFKKADDKKPKEQKLPKSKIAVILYKDGRHELIADPAAAAASLKATKTQTDQITGVDNTLKTDANANTGNKNASNASDDAVAFPGGPEEFEKFRNKALIKVDELGTYLATIVDPKTPAEKANSTIGLAVTLFVNEDARVEVSNVNTGIKNKYKIRDYLRRLKLVGADYQEVEVSYADISYATDFRKGPDGNYYGVVSFVQTFKGLVDGKVVYGDVTQRNVTVILKLYEKAVDGETKKLWDVFLADVGIEETRKL